MTTTTEAAPLPTVTRPAKPLTAKQLQARADALTDKLCAEVAKLDRTRGDLAAVRLQLADVRKAAEEKAANGTASGR